MYRQLDAGAETAECQYGFLWEGRSGLPQGKSHRAVYDEKTHRRTVVCISTDITAERRMQELYEKELQYLHQTNDGTLTSKGHFDLTEGTAGVSTADRHGAGPIDSHDYDTLMQNFLDTLENEKDREIIKNLADRKTLIQEIPRGRTASELPLPPRQTRPLSRLDQSAVQYVCRPDERAYRVLHVFL
jgi:hypothetical protein